jgi:NADPH:quinone reductase-like Zn-dependent oxidoreductase
MQLRPSNFAPVMSRMKLYEITEHNGIDSLKLTERPTPRPGPGEVLMRVGATLLNSRDLMMIIGTTRWTKAASS